MKVTQEKLPASQIGLEIEIEPETSKQAYEKKLQEFTRTANIPGFRKGKVPRQVLVQRFGSTRIKATVLEELIETSLKQALEQEKIDAIGQFELRSSFDQLVSQFEPGSPLTFSATVDVAPQAHLSNYKGLHVKAEEVTYDPAKVDEVLESYRSRNATLVPIEGRAAQQGDVAVVDFKGHLQPNNTEEEAEPEEIPGGSATDFEIELLNDRFIPGFIDGIIGMAVAETKEISATFPDDYMQEDLAGREGIFTVTLKELKEKELPELDDEFAQDVSEFGTLAELRDSLVSRFQQEATDKTRANKHEALLNELVKLLEVELPETLIRQEIDSIVTQMAMQFSNQGMDIRRLFTPELVQQLQNRSRPEAINRLRRSIALGEVAKQESIQASPNEVNTKVNEFLSNYSRDDIDVDRLRQVMEEDVLKEKIFNWLEENSTVELVPEGFLSTAESAEPLAAPPTELLEPVAVDQETMAESIAEPANAPTSSSEIEASSIAVADDAIAAQEPLVGSDDPEIDGEFAPQASVTVSEAEPSETEEGKELETKPSRSSKRSVKAKPASSQPEDGSDVGES
jgi:trigger factor